MRMVQRSSLMIIRSEVREARRRELLSRTATAAISSEETNRMLLGAAITARVSEALSAVDEQTRALLVDPYLR
jgi:hypothetical protein